MLAQINCRSWNHFKTEYRKILAINHSEYNNDDYLFRGQMNVDWNIKSSFDRIEKNKSKHDLLIIRFKETLIKHRHSLLDINNIDDDVITAFGQHHGLPTRLIDWTTSPYIASFFAFSDAISNDYKGRLIAVWAINKRSKAFENEPGLRFIEIPNDKINLRLKNQLGQFTLSEYPQDSLEEFIETISNKKGVNDALWKFNIPLSECKEALADLELMNINYNTIYPDVQGFAKDSVYKILK